MLVRLVSGILAGSSEAVVSSITLIVQPLWLYYFNSSSRALLRLSIIVVDDSTLCCVLILVVPLQTYVLVLVAHRSLDVCDDS